MTSTAARPDDARSRRNFLRGRFRRLDSDAMRPPQAVPGMEDICTGCADCARACPQGIIVIGTDRRPLVDLRRGECTFCGDCARACRSGALDPEGPLNWPWRAQISDRCISVQGTTCRACDDSCDARAIRFRLMTGGRSIPIVDFCQCTGCGACATVCPTAAIGFGRPAQQDGTKDSKAKA
ncbi:ferredoxin-type protein NapF [Paracoccus sp. p3-h83]